MSARSNRFAALAGAETDAMLDSGHATSPSAIACGLMRNHRGSAHVSAVVCS